MEETAANNIPPVRPRRWLKRLGIGGSIAFIFLITAAAGSAWGYTWFYRNRVYPGVTVGAYDLGGLTAPELKAFIENLNNRYSKEGISLHVTNSARTNNAVTVNTLTGGDDAVEVVKLDSDALVSQALRIGRGGTWWEDIFQALHIRFYSAAIRAPVVVNTPVLHDLLVAALHPWEDTYRDASIQVLDADTGNTKVIAEKSGQAFQYDTIIDAIKDSLSRLSFATIPVQLEKFSPTITTTDITPLLPNVVAVLNAGTITFTAPTTTDAPMEWSLTPADLAVMLAVERNEQGGVLLTLEKDRAEAYINKIIRPWIDVAPKDAKFSIEDNKMKEFQASKDGQAVNADATYALLKQVFDRRNYSVDNASAVVPLVIDVVTPTVKTADIDGLGISAIIGAGTSTFHDSLTNRIKNIANAVKRLNGTLIAPGEVFSANKYAGPYTLENGFLPEQVIKGREITPEIGGGMCQIGTTLFRMAMNSGMQITERHNHSLVVHYYADPVNGNPGTDATLYEPLLDLKFLNDTGNYLLLLTKIDYKKQMLTFTLWGKPDGRSGSYTHPKVSKWIPFPPDTQYIAQTDGTVPVGTMKCQAAFKGAVANFMYTRTTPDGQTIEQEFDSYYRPLPKICTVGVDPATCPKGAPCALSQDQIEAASSTLKH